MADADYTVSGRYDSFEFQTIDSIKSVTDTADGKLNGVIGGTITWDDTTDLKVSGTLNVSDTPMLHNKFIRIYYVSRIPQMSSTGSFAYKTYKYLLATCYADTEKGHYENGKYSGTISLQGTLSRYIDDEIARNFTMDKGTNILSYIKKVFGWYGGQYKISGIKGRKCEKTHVWEFGSAPFKVIAENAAFIGGVLTSQRDGVTLVSKYIEPAKRPVTFSFPTGANSVTLVGIDIASTQGSAINRAAVRYMKDEKYTDSKGKEKTRQVPIYGMANLDSSNIASKAKTGRFITYTETVSTMKPETTAQANKIAKNRLNLYGGYTVQYTINCLFLPISIGQVCRFKYDKIDIDGVVLSIDYDLKPGCPMKVVLQKLRNHK